MMTSSTRNVFHVTGRLWGESTGHRWIPPTKASDAKLYFFMCAWTNDWANHRDAGDLRHHHAHYYVTVTFPSKIGSPQYNLGIYSISILFKVEVLWHCRHVSCVRSNSGTVNHSLKSVIKGWGEWNTVKPLQVQEYKKGPIGTCCHLFRYINSHYKYKTVVRSSYLLSGYNIDKSQVTPGCDL